MKLHFTTCAINQKHRAHETNGVGSINFHFNAIVPKPPSSLFPK